MNQDRHNRGIHIGDNESVSFNHTIFGRRLNRSAIQVRGRRSRTDLVHHAADPHRVGLILPISENVAGNTNPASSDKPKSLTAIAIGG